MSQEKKLAIVSGLVEGVSVRSLERITGAHRDSIVRLLWRVGDGCSPLLGEKMRGLDLRSIQCDEIWSYCHTKQGHLRPGDPAEYGDQFVFVALDARPKLVPCFEIGKRDSETANRFMLKLRASLNGHRVQITTDGFTPYVWAVEQAFGADVDYAQEIKSFEQDGVARDRYRPPDFVTTQEIVIAGHPDGRRISTSFVERQNLTMRMQMRRFTRLTNAFSKRLPSLRAAVALHFAHYNFVRPHITLKITPAMAAGVTGHFWTLSDLLECEAPYSRN
jgi:IS1 family transposase